MHIRDFYNRHTGETCLIVGVGSNLKHTPPEWFDYPSFGVNTIYKYDGWKPTYFVGVDERLEREDGAAIAEKYRDIPKFIPRPDRDTWQGENFYRFYHRAGLPFVGGLLANHPDALDGFGITYARIMGAVFQIAWHMGFTTMLLIGIEHNPDDARAHFWGEDVKSVANQPFNHWFDEYQGHVRSMTNVRVLNISENTWVPEDVLPRGDWREWRNVHEIENA